MNARERILKTINHEEPDRIPSFEAAIDNLSIWNYYKVNYPKQGIGKSFKRNYYLFFGSKKLLTNVYHRMAKKERTIKSNIKPIIELYNKIGIEFACVDLCLYPKFLDKTGYIDEFGRRFDFKKNPADNMDMLYYIGGNFKDLWDYEAFPPLNPDNPRREKTFKIAKDLEEKFKGKIYIAPSIMGMMESTWEAFGFQNFSRLLAQPKKIKKIFDDRGKFAVELVKRIVDWGETGTLFVLDDYGYKSGLFMSPRNYRKYVLPWLKRICKIAHKSGLSVILHSCGDIYPILEDLIKAGIDALNPIEPTTSNPKYDIFKLKKKYGENVCFIGNVSPQDLSDKDPNYIREYTKRLIDKIAPGGGFILSSGHSITPAIKLENFLAMRDTLVKYGNYPL